MEAQTNSYRRHDATALVASCHLQKQIHPRSAIVRKYDAFDQAQPLDCIYILPSIFFIFPLHHISSYSMADTHQRRQPSSSERFIRGAGTVREDPDQRLWWPARMVVQLVQYMIAIIMVTIAEGTKAIFKGGSARSNRRRNTRPR